MFDSVKALIVAYVFHYEKFYVALVAYMFTVIQKIYICKVRNSHFYGILIDEFTCINITGHFLMIATIVDEGLLVLVFLGLLKIEGDKNDVFVRFDY